jgi:hypothetical protein
VTVPQKQKGVGRHESASMEGSRLAHWPPPFRSGTSKPIIMKHPRGETPKRATPRGWRLTRAQFSEFQED